MQGELDILKGDHSYRQVFETLIDPLSYDKIVPGRALSLEQLRDLQLLCEGLNLRVPRQWSVLGQKAAIEQLRRRGIDEREQLSRFLVQLKQQAETGDLAPRVEYQIAQWLALEKGEHELQGFQHFLYTIQSPMRFLVEQRELAQLPARFEKLFREAQRLRHVFSYPCLAECQFSEVSQGLALLGELPSFSQPDDVEKWLCQAQALFQRYQDRYRGEHEKWWEGANQHIIWNYQAPSIARSRHVGVESLVAELEGLQQRASREKCTGLGSLEFQPLCRCGFDGGESPLAATLRSFEAAHEQLEKELCLFFSQDKVKAKIQQWVDQKLEMNGKTLAYLEAQSAYPTIENLPLFDQHLSGIELTRNVSSETFFDRLLGHPWEKASLLKEIEQLFNRYGPRICFQKHSFETQTDLAQWCCELSLQLGRPLPSGFSLAEKKQMAEWIHPEWIKEEGLNRLEQLGMAEEVIDRVLGMILEGLILKPRQLPEFGAVRAAFDLLNSSVCLNPQALAKQSTNLYLQHRRLAHLRPQPWLSYLESVANASLSEEPGELAALLRNESAAQWVVMDCLGLPVLETLLEKAPASFPHWKVEKLRFARVASKTTTDQFYRDLLDSVGAKSLEKVNTIDNLVHSQGNNFEELLERLEAELEIAGKRLSKKLDSSRELLMFGDHGLRLASDGTKFCHGGASTLERVVPVLKLVPWH
jgi:hypothetical protein